MDASGSGQRLFSTTRSVAKRALQEESQITTHKFKSPFYEGRTMFGGSSAKISRLSASSPYALAKQSSYLTRIKDADIKRADAAQPLSNSAKQILKNMERITSPINDAKRMPVGNVSSAPSIALFEPSRPFRRVSTSKTSALASSSFVSSPVGDQKPLMKWDSPHTSSSTASSSRPTHSGQTAHLERKSADAPVGGKMRAFASTSRHKDSEPEVSTYPTSELKNIPLPITSLPSFDFLKNKSQAGSEASYSNQSSASLQSNAKRSYEEMVSNEHESEFQFSAPKVIKYALMKIKPKRKPEETNKPVNTYSSLSNPLIKNDPKTKDTIGIGSSKINDPFATSGLGLDAKKPLTSVKLNTESSKPSEDRSAAISKSPIKPLSMFTAPANTWECETCLVRNDMSAVKCQACETAKVIKKDSSELSKSYIGFEFGKVNTKRDSACNVLGANDTTSGENKTSNFNSLFANQIGSKENISVNLLNSGQTALGASKTTIDLSKKPADILSLKNIQTPSTGASSLSAVLNKPLDTKSSLPTFKFDTKDMSKAAPASTSDINKSTSTASGATTSSLNMWGDKFAPPKDTWECTECLVQNKSDASKCISCETPKAGASTSDPTTTSTSSPAPPVFKFGSASGGLQFKAPTLSTEPSSENKPADKPMFTFGSSTVSGLTSPTSATSGFTFGNKADIKFGSSTTTESTTDKSGSANIFGSKDTTSGNSKLTTGIATTINKDTPSLSGSGLFSSSSSTLSKPLENSFGNRFGAPLNSWKCRGCDVMNKPEDDKCCACKRLNDSSGTSAPTASGSALTGASASSDLKTSSNLFKLGSGTDKPATMPIFGSNAFSLPTTAATTKSDSTPLLTTSSSVTSTTAPGKPAFSFNFTAQQAGSTSTTKASTSTPFNFGAAASSTSTAAFSGVSKTDSSSSGSTVAPKVPAPATFVFGSSSATSTSAAPFTAVSKPDASTASTAVSTASSSTTTPFFFGSSSSANSTSAPLTNTAFGSSGTQNALNTSATAFGSTSGNLFASNSTAKFTFGQPSTSTSSNPLSPASATNGGFNFAASSVNGNSANVFGTQNTSAPAPALQFNTGQPPISFSSTPSINFSIGVDSSNVFQFAAKTDSNSLNSTNSHPARNIKKAKRRLGPTS